MAENFYPLTCDEDILLIRQDTFTVARFKEFTRDSLNSHIYYRVERTLQKIFEIFYLLNSYQYRIDKKVILPLKQSAWSIVSEPIECKMVNLASGKGWISGRLIIKTRVNLFPEEYKKLTYEETPHSEIEIELEFCPDDPEQSESILEQPETLDDLWRKLESL